MKMIFNNKVFVGRYNGEGKLVIHMDTDEDKIYFKKWQDKQKKEDCYKKDYVEDIKFWKVTERGILKNCFPIVHLNEDIVHLVYDLYKIIED